MKRICVLAGLLMSFYFGFGQEDIIQSTRRNVDSILQKIEQEPSQGKRFDLILTIFDTRVEGYPLLVLETFQKLLQIAKKLNDPVVESNAYSFAGQGYRLTASYIKALEYHHKAIALAEKSGNPSVLAWAQNQIGHIYKDREENDKAIYFYSNATANARIGKVPDLEAWAMMNLAAVFLNANQPDSSLYYGKLAFQKLIDRHKAFSQESYILSNMAGAYSKKGDTENALLYFRRAIESAIETQSPRYKGIAYVAYAEHFQRNKQMDSCNFYAKKAIAVVQNTLFSYMAIKPAKMLLDIYENSNADSAIKYMKIFRVANDSLNDTRANQQLQMMTFEEDQRTRDIAAAKLAYQNKIRTNLMLAGLGIVLLIALILYRNNQQRKRTNLILEKTLNDLRSTQTQLIQSEKMASLGELTAGIAHEIQNPLNFVNNFSEVSNELIDEMKDELAKGNYEDVSTIADDVKQNLEKINHHGKRADAIVKGMLQHSQTSKGQKEPTDLNALVDEYLRLSYHGLRAKDNSFNATIETSFDNSLQKVNIIPQDIGRVVLNIITNAFYAVNEKKQTTTGYEPKVTVSSKALKSPSGDLEATVVIMDNGSGIPSSIIDKIFQPFFTTKPTGQGTGLGLSLAYDIVKAHGGEIKVDSKAGEGTTFIIKLPNNNA